MSHSSRVSRGKGGGGLDTTRQTRREERKQGCHLCSVTLHPSGTSDHLVMRRGRISIIKLPTFISHTLAVLLRLSSLRQFLLGKKQKFSNSSAATQKKTDFCACTTASFFMMRAQKTEAKSMRGTPRRCLCHHIVLDDASLLPFKHKGKSQGQSWLTIG